MKYIKKPVEIEAIQWNGKNTKKVRDFCNSGDGWNCGQTSPDNLEIYTLEGTMYASVNDYIIKGVNGEFYPCKPDIFEKTYEKTPTLEEIKKEWKELGYEWRTPKEYPHMIHLVNDGDDMKWVLEIKINTQSKIYWKHWGDMNFESFTFQEHQLLTKTFRALGWFE